MNSPTLSIGASVDFSRSRHQAAALFIRNEAESRDVILEGWFRTYLLKHYRSWHAFMQQRGFGTEVHDIIFVTGHDLTGEWATAVIYDRDVRSGAQVTTGSIPPMLVSASASLQATFTTSVSLPVRKGPKQGSQLPSPRPTTTSVQEGTESESIRQVQNQCIFIRGLRIVERIMRSPKVIRAAAGDEDLDSDKNPEPYAKIVSAESDSDSSNDIVSQDKVRGNVPLFPSSTE